MTNPTPRDPEQQAPGISLPGPDFIPVPGISLQVLDAAGWRVEPEPLGVAEVHAWSPDRLIYTSFQSVEGSGPGWMTRAYREPIHDETGPRAAPVWVAEFHEDAPDALVAAFLTAVIDPTGITRDPLEPGTMLHPPPPIAT